MSRATLVALLVASSGCYHIKYTNGGVQPLAPSEEKWHHSFVFGFIESGNGVDLSKECPQGTWAAVEHQYNTVDTAIQIILRIPPISAVGAPVLWVWTPTHTRVTCAAPSVASPPVVPPSAAVEKPPAAAPPAPGAHP